MFSYGIFSLVWNFDHENFSSWHLWYQAKKIQYLDISLLAAGPLITVSLSLDSIEYYTPAGKKHENSWLQIVDVWGGGSGLPVTFHVKKTPNQGPMRPGYLLF